MNRRAFLKAAPLTVAPVASLSPIGPAWGQQGSHVTHSPLKIVCVGGHPDDPESGCAGTLARYAQLGHGATIIYLTRGERGIRGKSLDQAAEIRTGESEAACKIMGAKAVFAGQMDGDTELNRARVDAFAKLLAAEPPDLLFTHWPADTHMDHQIASLLAQRGAAALSKQPQIYFFEVNTGSQSQGFTPNVYVDISSVIEKKKAALFAHRSQDGEAIWRDHHEPIARFRGREAGVAFAEAFVHLNRDNKTGVLPGLSLLGP